MKVEKRKFDSNLNSTFFCFRALTPPVTIQPCFAGDLYLWGVFERKEALDRFLSAAPFRFVSTSFIVVVVVVIGVLLSCFDEGVDGVLMWGPSPFFEGFAQFAVQEGMSMVPLKVGGRAAVAAVTSVGVKFVSIWLCGE